MLRNVNFHHIGRDKITVASYNFVYPEAPGIALNGQTPELVMYIYGSNIAAAPLIREAGLQSLLT